jgi:hypothetical protein
MEKYIYDALYYYKDDDGEEGYNLFNVQTLDDKDKNRIEILKGILNNEDKYIAYQAMLILLSWGIKEGVDKLNVFIEEKWQEKLEFEPHRIYNEDNVFDVIADALDIAWYNSTDRVWIIDKMKILLSFYGIMFFEGKLKKVLLKRDEIAKSLLIEIQTAMQSALLNKRYYQASQLLSVINKYDKNYVHSIIPEFEKLSQIDNRINFNLEELLVK